MGASDFLLPEEKKKRDSNRTQGTKAWAGLGLNHKLLIQCLFLEPRLAHSCPLTQTQAAAWARPRMDIICGEATCLQRALGYPGTAHRAIIGGSHVYIDNV